MATSSPVRVHALGIRMNDGPNITVGNRASARNVTKALLADYFWGSDKTAYQAGKRPVDIPLSPASFTSGRQFTDWAVTADGERIGGIVGAGSPGIPTYGFSNQAYNILGVDSEGDPDTVSVNVGPVVAIFVYEGTAPEPSGASTATNASKIVGSSTLGTVRIAANATENALGWTAIAVDSTLGLVAAIKV